MRFPFVLRADHDEMVAELRAGKVSLEKELRRLKDLIFKNTFGVRIHDTIPESVVAAEAAEPEEDQVEDESDREYARLQSLARTRPSQLGPAMEQAMARRVLVKARAAHPPMAITRDTASPAMQVFDSARKDVEEAVRSPHKAVS